MASVPIGLIVVLQSRAGLARFEASHLLPEVAMGSLVRQVLQLFNGLLLAGRVGAALGSEMGSLTLSKQVASLEILGLGDRRRADTRAWLTPTKMRDRSLPPKGAQHHHRRPRDDHKTTYW